MLFKVKILNDLACRGLLDLEPGGFERRVFNLFIRVSLRRRELGLVLSGVSQARQF